MNTVSCLCKSIPRHPSKSRWSTLATLWNTGTLVVRRDWLARQRRLGNYEVRVLSSDPLFCSNFTAVQSLVSTSDFADLASGDCSDNLPALEWLAGAATCLPHRAVAIDDRSRLRLLQSVANEPATVP